jgi:hypothetical protein
MDLSNAVMPGHSRSKNGVASFTYVPGIHVLFEETQGKAWMAGTSPIRQLANRSELDCRVFRIL